MTGGEWIERMPPEYRIKFIINLSEDQRHYNFVMNEVYSSMYSLVCSAFGWASSPEGAEYWSAFANRYADDDEWRWYDDYKTKPYNE